MDAYFDMFSGISGNMILGALLDLGLEQEVLENELAKLGLSDEYGLTVKRVSRSGIAGTYVKVEVRKHSHDSGQAHTHGRHFSDIKNLINKSELSTGIKKKSIAIFTNLARVEAGIHGVDREEIHFHEVGAVDAIVDIVGSVIGLELLGVNRINGSRINTGRGFVDCEHGTIPVPAPATMELLQGIPVYSTGMERELVTPTGAAIITTLAGEFGSRPGMKIKKTGYGAGSYRLAIPNLLRVNLGYMEKEDSRDTVDIIETNIDDMNPEFYDYIMEKLFTAGALDVYFTPIQMKKNRPAVKLSVLVESGKVEEMVEILLAESTSLGVRVIDNVRRICLDREIKTVSTPWGEVRVKISSRAGKMVNAAPEYEDCKGIAAGENIALKTVYDYVKKKISEIDF